jgi:hypothetical protein
MAKKGWVITPNGYRHHSQVHALKKDEWIEGSGAHIRIGNRNNQQVISLEPQGPAPVAMDALPSGWSVFAGWSNDTGSPVNAFRTAWTVPAAPPTSGQQTVFLFSGIEDGSAVPFILQPVLQWGVAGGDPNGGSDDAIGGPYWSAACWYAGPPGQASVHGPSVKVQPDETLTGVMTLMGQTPNGCSYSCVFEEYPETRLIITDKPELLWCNLCLEAYAIDSCANFPPGGTSFSPIQLATGNASVTPNWSEDDAITGCGQAGTLVGNGTAACIFNINF